MIGKIILKIFEKGEKKNVRRMKRITLEFKKKKSKGDLNKKEGRKWGGKTYEENVCEKEILIIKEKKKERAVRNKGNRKNEIKSEETKNMLLIK